ncbi:MAG: hypothetical protein AAGK21_13120 [Bacteroidota bacterium]
MRVFLATVVLALSGCSAAEQTMNDVLNRPALTAPSPTFAADVVHGAVDWSTSVYDYRGRNGDVVAFDCQGDPSATPPSGVSAVYGGGRDGTGLFTDDSRVFVEIRPESDSFPGGFTRNGASTVDWTAAAGGGFVVLGAR